LCNYGLATVFDSKKPGPTIIFRAELDALPINEENNYSYSSQLPNVSHSCGHDGHMTILLGLASVLNKQKLKLRGKIILLFQPAEETAKGAKCIMESDLFHSLKPDYIFSIHNLPGFEKEHIVQRFSFLLSSFFRTKKPLTHFFYSFFFVLFKIFAHFFSYFPPLLF